MNIKIKELSVKDIDDYKNIRLELLQNAPTNFGSSYEEEKAFEESMWINRLSKNTVITLGAYVNKEIVGLTVCVTSPRSKMKHVASIHSVYVKEDYRKLSIANELMTKAFSLLQERAIEQVNLSVVSDNVKAINLYEKLGFTTYGLEPNSIKYEEKYYDLLLMSKSL